VVKRGTFIHDSDFLPKIGYQAAIELTGSLDSAWSQGRKQAGQISPSSRSPSGASTLRVAQRSVSIPAA